MSQTIILIGGFIVAFAGALLLASKNGSKSAQLDALKAEIKKQTEERKHAQKINDNVSAMSDDDVRNRLHAIANKQR